jgi:hypothetical protein
MTDFEHYIMIAGVVERQKEERSGIMFVNQKEKPHEAEIVSGLVPGRKHLSQCHEPPGLYRPGRDRR